MASREGVQSTDAQRARLTAALGHVSRGDRQALRDVYDMSAAKLFGVCLRICRDRDVAADIVQETYLKVWTRAGSFDPAKASPITWLATIARNGAIDWRRANQRLMVDIDEADIIADDQPDAIALIEADQDRARIHQCLEELGGEPERAIRSAFFGGLTYAELATHMAVPLGTMKSWIRRGLAQLKDCISHG